VNLFRPHGGCPSWPLDTLRTTPARYIFCTEDRLFPAAFQRRLVRERLGIIPDEIVSGHCPALSRPAELAAMLDTFTRAPAGAKKEDPHVH
jgi:pimeloyl-ACP methyl ester carboxylesterase